MNNSHEYWMAQAIRLAEKGLTSTDPNPRVGCILVKNGERIATGWHKQAGQAHAEVNALQSATTSPAGATAYVTLEPCSHHGRTGPCADALIAAGVKTVVIGMQDPNPQVAGSGIQKLRDASIHVISDILRADAMALNPGFIKRMQTGLPFVRLKLAASLDGRTALANGDSQWITNPAARQDVQQYRARSSAIVTGIGTVLADNPSLNVRLPNTQRQPLRVVLDSQLRTPADAKLFSVDGATLILHTQPHTQQGQSKTNQQHALPNLQPQTVLHHLGQLEANEVWVEAGAKLAGSFLDAQVVDELIIYLAPKILGPDAQPLAVTNIINQLQNAHQWRYQDTRSVGSDLRLTLTPVDTSTS